MGGGFSIRVPGVWRRRGQPGAPDPWGPFDACLAAGPRCQEQSGCGSVSMARHLEPRRPPRRRSGQEAEPGSPSPAQQPGKLGQEARSLVGGIGEGVPYFSRDEGLTCLYFPLHLGEVDNRVLSWVHVQYSSPPLL